ncbi:MULTISPECIES: M48 family metallopeptidase [unclassified Marinobacter]|uniref:M48 family metallopeptidase n=1 Tax=unclassified Marinobacter TaxID=83889 RepID=UPI0026E3BCC6|nr:MULTISPECIES: M48 family metallopeptidase [unclassified Marinobacter]MDO6443674.1 M48 family metallopeptidase [Marinobacter sp. 2_MG-2023]MDO6823338.1 M48 family metallopeptidase [Marinobacter sp. 1_MG-2023]
MAHPGFFQRQASARRNTSLLVFLFITAVMLITLAVCLVGYLVTRSETSGQPFHYWLLSSHGLITASAVVILICMGSLIRWADLSGGGSRVAKMVGARPIDPDTRDGDERKLRNIVEEMAIASGVPVPELYIMDSETGINAFVAGYTPGSAVMVVTHGAITQLTRDELQGVVGHEFSHIFNGDMRLNVRLIALLAGILMIGQIGGFLVRVSFYSGGRTTARNRDGRAQAAMGLLGIALFVIGYLGVFFGRLIQAAVSRQRETLADASSVQFTRNPEGIGGALFKIGLRSSYLDTTGHASDMNHMCFGEAARMKFSALLASHPPIDQRINAIQPGLMARLKSRLRDTEPGSDLRAATTGRRPEGASGFADTAADIYGSISGRRTSPSGSAIAAPTPTSTTAQKLSERVGTVSPEGEDFAVHLLRRLPSTFRGLLYTRAGAIQLCYALLVSDLDKRQQEECLGLLPEHSLLGAQSDLLAKLIPALQNLGEAVRFPALELAMPALRKLDPDERAQLIRNARKLVNADKRITLFELTLTSFLSRHLGVDSDRAMPVRHRSYKPVMPALQRLLSLLARAGAGKSADAGILYREAIAGFASRGSGDYPILTKVTMKQLQEALKALNGLSPLLKPAVIDACGHCITYDGVIEVREYELMRLVADQMDCPMPPMTI